MGVHVERGRYEGGMKMGERLWGGWRRRKREWRRRREREKEGDFRVMGK